jgi:phenylacetate-CoA ligase
VNLAAQLAWMERASPFYAERIAGRRELTDLPFTTKEALRASQAADPPFGAHLCAPREELVRMHVTSGTTGEPVAIGLTARDHAANSRIGGDAFAIAGVRADDVIAHCLNYALYAGGVADHMALEASGATVVPVGVGQSARLLELIPRLGITALFGTLSYPVHLAQRARVADLDPVEDLGLRLIVTAGEPGAGIWGMRGRIEALWEARVRDSFGMSDMWSTMAGECDAKDGLHLTTGGYAVLEVVDPESGEPVVETDPATGMPAADAEGELVWTHLRREASPLLRYRSADLGRVRTSPCACGRTTPRIRIDGRRDDMLRVQAVNVYPHAIGEVLGRHGSERWLVIADGDPIEPPLRIFAEGGGYQFDVADVEAALHATLRVRVKLTRVALGCLPVGEQKTRMVYRPALGDEPPDIPPACLQ